MSAFGRGSCLPAICVKLGFDDSVSIWPCRQNCYAASDITILTPYNGQLRLLHRCMAENVKVFLDEADQQLAQPGSAWDVQQSETISQSVRLATVDKFQGELPDLKLILNKSWLTLSAGLQIVRRMPDRVHGP